MVQELQLTQEEVLFLKKIYKIKKAQSELFKWFVNTEIEIKEKGLNDLDKELPAKWARKQFDKLRLEKAEKFILCPEIIPERERIELGD